MSTLSIKQEKAIAAILTNPTIAAAATEANLSRETLHKYLGDPAFKARLREYQDAIIKTTTAVLVGLSGESLQVMLDILRDENASQSLRLRVATAWLDQRRKSVDLDDLAERVIALEEKLG